MRAVWPTKFVSYPGDIIHISQLANDFTCYSFIAPELECVAHKEIWNGEKYVKTWFDGHVKQVLERGQIKDGYLVTVDYHR